MRFQTPLILALPILATAGCEIGVVDPYPPIFGSGHPLTFAAEDPGSPAIPLIYRANTNGSDLRALAIGSSPDWSPEGSEILFLDQGVRLMSAGGGNSQTLREADASRFPVWAGWSPSGGRFAYLEKGWGACNAIYVGSPYGQVDEDLGNHCSPGEDLEWRLDWSPAGDELLFHSDGPIAFSLDVFVAEVGGTTTWNLTYSPWNDHSPAWSPDGYDIVFISDRNVGPWAVGELFIMDWEGSNVARITPGSAATPSFSPDGRWIAFFRPDDGLYIVRPDGSGEERLTSRGSARAPFPAAPRWSPDGEWLAFVSDSGYLYTIRMDGSDEQRISDTRLVGGAFSWSPRRVDWVD